jgi:hypothetical protein
LFPSITNHSPRHQHTTELFPPSPSTSLPEAARQ